jgi:transcriptional regulator with XRE-family HTH domain
MKEVQKDPVRAKRLDEVYKHLFAHFGITSQKHLAEVLKVQRTGLSSAFNGNVANLTDNLFKKICAAFPGVFNLDYLLTGKGYLLTVEEDVKSTEFENANRQMPTQPSATEIDASSAINAAIAAYVELTNRLKQEMNDRLSDKDTIIAEKQARIASLEQTVADKDAIIRARDARIIELERQIANINASDLSRYPFAIGAAEEQNNPNVSPYPTNKP